MNSQQDDVKEVVRSKIKKQLTGRGYVLSPSEDYDLVFSNPGANPPLLKIDICGMEVLLRGGDPGPDRNSRYIVGHYFQKSEIQVYASQGLSELLEDEDIMRVNVWPTA